LCESLEGNFPRTETFNEQYLCPVRYGFLGSGQAIRPVYKGGIDAMVGGSFECATEIWLHLLEIFLPIAADDSCSQKWRRRAGVEKSKKPKFFGFFNLETSSGVIKTAEACVWMTNSRRIVWGSEWKCTWEDKCMQHRSKISLLLERGMKLQF